MLNALSTRRVFRKIVITTLAAGAPLFAFVACTAGTGPLAGTEAGSGMDQCYTERIDAGGCETFTLQLLGDPTTCGFDDDGGAGGFATGSQATCQALCGRPFCERNGTSVTCRGACAVDGRRYTSLDDACAPAATDVGSYLARMAFFEAASVDAFELLEAALSALGAPPSLRRSCRRARLDEVRHARMASRLARRHGGVVVVAPVRSRPEPVADTAAALEALAIENAVEGCTRETFGVLLGLWQAERAATPALRAFFATLAADESRHAALARRVDTWARTRLSAHAQARVEAARGRALDDLRASLETSPSAFTRELGLPSPSEAVALFHAWVASTEVYPASASPASASSASASASSACASTADVSAPDSGADPSSGLSIGTTGNVAQATIAAPAKARADARVNRKLVARFVTSQPWPRPSRSRASA